MTEHGLRVATHVDARAPDRGARDVEEVLDALPDGVLLSGPDQQVTCANRAAALLLRRDHLVGRSLGEVMALSDLDGRDWCSVNKPYSGLNTRRLLVEQAWRLDDGTELLVDAMIRRESPQHPVQQVAVCLRSARARSRLDRERSDLVATVAHELRSPLTGVRGFTGTLLARWDKFSDEQKRLIMQSVHSDTDRLTRLITELLDVARIDTGRLTLRPRPIDPAEPVRQVAGSVRAGTGREIAVELAAELPLVLADPDRLTQVLTNLVENAVVHGDGQVCVTVRPTEVEGRAHVEISVRDEGKGIPPQMRGRVFTKFWKHGTRGGSGLGLYLAHGLVLAHEGRIAIGEADGGGALVQTLWPAYVTERAALLD